MCAPELLLRQHNVQILLSETVLERVAGRLADLSNFSKDHPAYGHVRQKVVQRMVDSTDFQASNSLDYGEYRHKNWEGSPRAKLHVFCPPELHYVDFALGLSPPDEIFKTCEFDVQIHLDLRLLDQDIRNAKEGRNSLWDVHEFVRLHADIGEPIDSFKLGTERMHRRQFLAARFDQVWLDQQVEILATGKTIRDPPSASEFFEASKEHVAVAMIVIMGCPEVCKRITSTAPLVSPDTPVQEHRIYRLEEFDKVDHASQLRWKTKHFCQFGSHWLHTLNPPVHQDH